MKEWWTWSLMWTRKLCLSRK